jgi:hypothetical protein
VEDLAGHAPGEREGQARRLAQEEAQAPFDLQRGPLLRVRLLRLHEQEHWLLLTLHHIITDGWSSGVLVRELSELYGAHCRGEASDLAPLPVQNADYAVWQGVLQGGAEQQLSYRKPALAAAGARAAGRPAATAIASCGADQLRMGRADPARRDWRTKGDAVRRCWRHRVPVSLQRAGGAVGAPIAGVCAELGGLIGFFVNTLVLRETCRGAELHCASGAGAGAGAGGVAHQDLPFEKLVEELHPKRDLSRNPLFRVSLMHATGRTVLGHRCS